MKRCSWLNGICPKPAYHKTLQWGNEEHWLCDEHYEYVGSDTEEKNG